MKSYEKQIAAKEKELENMKREVTNFRASLYGIYKEHLAVIEKIPTFDLPEEEQEEKAPAEEPTPVYTEPEVIEEPEEEIPVPAAQQVEEEPAPAPESRSPLPHLSRSRSPHRRRYSRSLFTTRTLILRSSSAASVLI